jgi:hypothetical protein
MKKKEINLIMRLMSGNPVWVKQKEFDKIHETFLANGENNGFVIKRLDMDIPYFDTKGMVNVSAEIVILPEVWFEWITKKVL